VPAVRAVPDVTGSERWVGDWAITLAGAAAATLASGRSAILAVPDYRDQEQLEAALRAVVPPEVIARLDARQSNADRYRAFLRCLDGDPLVIIGNRSVVYAPAANLGLIALWDDGDPLYAEPLSPYVHCRDAALVRQEQQDCALIFFGHTRSTEVERLVEIGWLRDISPERRLLPKVVPTLQQSGGDRLATGARIPSSAWKVARTALEFGPVLVQVARPGYAPRLACVKCDHTARCLRCEGPLAQRESRSVPACQWCGALAVGWHCSNCDGTTMRFVGIGATRTAEELGRAFPGVRVVIADGERPILTVGSEPSLVIATRGAEPVAQGGYRAVLLLDGERMVARESLRVGEDCLRWWSNAVALAAPGAHTMLVGVGGALAAALVTWRQADYARAELADRQRLRFPPAVRVATISGPPAAVASAVEAVAVESAIPPEDVLGPVTVDAETVRTIVRFDYARGTKVAAALRAAVVTAAAHRPRPKLVDGQRRPLPPVLKARLDDIEPFLDSQY
jgi:primosomal protein N' (replication factor Y)